MTGFSDDNNVGNQSVEQFDNSAEGRLDWATTNAVRDVIRYVVYALGIPGNILSAIVWLRRHVASENPSAIYLAALAIDDLIYLIVYGVKFLLGCEHTYHWWLCRYLNYPIHFAGYLEPLLVLGFSVVRLIAILRPLQVCLSSFYTNRKLNCGRKTTRRSI